jgi:uncharacterized protein YbjT (DUF2867 family)
MKILITGVTGFIGGAALEHCLLHPAITSVVALSRRELPQELMTSDKLSFIVVKDFGALDEDVLSSISDANGMIWLVLIRPPLLTQHRIS